MQSEHDIKLQDDLHPLTDESAMQSYLKLISQRSPQVHFPPTYSILHFLSECRFFSWEGHLSYKKSPTQISGSPVFDTHLELLN